MKPNRAQRFVAVLLSCMLTSSAFAEDTSLMEAMKKRAEPMLVAIGLLGTPYKRGGTDPARGVDCSGLVHYVYKQSSDIDLPHSASELSRTGDKVSKNELEPGDLVFFKTLRKRISHVGIYAGDGKFIHASSPVGKEVMMSRLDDSYWSRHYAGARRVLAEATK